MDEAPSAPSEPAHGRGRAAPEPQAFAAVDLGTNNCRLLIATRAVAGLSDHRRLFADRAAGRGSVADRRPVGGGAWSGPSRRWGSAPTRSAAAASRGCAPSPPRPAARRENGPAFLERVTRETGLKLTIITPREEAQLSVAGCLNLLDRQAEAALVLDVGGGSTELSWIDLKAPGLDVDPRRMAHGAADQGLALDPDRRRDPGRALPGRAEAAARPGSGRWSTP